MIPVIEISEAVVKRLKRLKKGTKGTLLTTADNSNLLLVLGLVITHTDDTIVYDLAELHAPGGLCYLGSFIISSDKEELEQNALTVVVNPVNGDIQVFYEASNGEPPKEVSYVEITGATVAEKLFVVRTRLVLPVCCEINSESIKTKIEYLRTTTLDEVMVSELNGVPLDKPFKTPGKKKNYLTINDIEIVEANVKLMASPSKGNPEQPSPALLIDYKKRTAKCCWFDLTLDTLTLVPRHENASYLSEFVGVSLRKELTLHENCLLTQLQETGSISYPETFHFLPQDAGHFISIIYPKNKLDRDLSDFRLKLHTAFDLPTDRPLLMRANAFPFTQVVDGGELINPHEAVGPSGVAGGEPSLVQGKYAYHHYCQQGMDDNGWGCAYRSLQTLCSWFKLQGYTNKAVPTIQEIQKCLVSIGDKPSSFVGSSQWIGSTEVGFCLDTLLGVSSRIVNVSSGDEMSMKGGELSHHFKTQGTPVMIGGGNLAHTILGVDYHRKTGDIKFLILDPHYTGADDLNTIISKGWCGWKGINFWKKGSFYNMCMPIRPKYI